MVQEDCSLGDGMKTGIDASLAEAKRKAAVEQGSISNTQIEGGLRTASKKRKSRLPIVVSLLSEKLTYLTMKSHLAQ